ncbi:DUF397 domain-containing protein [Sphaerisporangium corydalis]|uniref:DUF397 domain-containing protein n=1 Tax=Sphaerisporangium corydalis TaxID=1441875 RepID=A0ABV9EGM8_9ACTN|nr:DUF397 domain-containing protein [Sphaerisporangium corydalis]
MLYSAQWRKSTYSADQDNCVEVASNLPGVFAVRDSKNPTGPALLFTSAEWTGFLRGVQAGTFNT